MVACLQVIAAVNHMKEAEILQKLQPSLCKSLSHTHVLFMGHSKYPSALPPSFLSSPLLPPLLPPVRVVDLSGNQSIVDVCLQETGGLGVHCVIDNGGKTLHYWL